MEGVRPGACTPALISQFSGFSLGVVDVRIAGTQADLSLDIFR